MPADRDRLRDAGDGGTLARHLGVACDTRGFVRVDAYLRSPSHANVFAAGDCATQDGDRAPAFGVYAVRQGPALAANLRASGDRVARSARTARKRARSR